jgi:beta-aspartyl-dipeptidase (metallo-type)
MFKLLKNANVYSPNCIGKKDILVVNDTIVAIDDQIDINHMDTVSYDYTDHIITPGLIDQHIHIAGAGGLNGYTAMTPEINISELIACGSTTVVGLLGTDGIVRNIRTVYAKAKALDYEGITAFMYSGYYGVDSVTITDSIQGDMIFIDKVLGCKVAISDIRSSYPTAIELLRKLRDVKVGGSIANKKGILHIHLGMLDTKMDILFELVNEHQFPIQHISPTHVGRTKVLFDQAIEFAKLGGIIDITTGASKYTDPYKMVLYALSQGVSIDNMTFSSDGHAGLSKFNESKEVIGTRVAPFDQNLFEIIQLIKIGGLSIADAFKLNTTNPARNLGLKNKGKIEVGCHADFCVFNKNFDLLDVFAKGQHLMKDKQILIKGTFE